MTASISLRTNDDGEPVLVIFDHTLFAELGPPILSEAAHAELLRLGPAIVEVPLRDLLKVLR